MLESISTPTQQRKKRAWLQLSTGNSQKITSTIDPRYLLNRQKINKQYSQQIPKRGPLPTPHLASFFDNNNTSSRIIGPKAIRLAETELQDKYKGDLSTYLRQKFKKYIGKKHQYDVYRQNLSPSLSHSSSDQHITFRQLLTLQKYDSSRHQKSTAVNQAYLRNAKQKIDRMIDLKRQRQDYYSDIKALLKKKLLQKAKFRQRIDQKSERKKEEWEKEWLNEYINEKKRYKKRLVNKSINKRYQLSPP